MTVDAAPPPLPSAEATELAVGAPERALRQGWRRLRFEAPLEDAYERDTGAGRTLRHIVCNLLGAGSYWFLSLRDSERLPEIGALLSTLSVWVMLACCCVVGLLTVFRSTLRGWQREALTALGTLTIVGYMVVITHHVSTAPMLMQLCSLLLIFLHVGIGARLQFRYALGVNLLAYIGFAWVVHGDSAEAKAVVDNELLLFGSVLLFSTVGNYLLELRERRSYLLQCLKTRRHDALLADADILREMALRDGLTNLYNRRHFDAEMARLWSAGLGDGRAVGVLQIDVDHFKAYNDRHGHPAGDRCLARVGAALQAAAERAGGIAARVGGEEFALLVGGLDDAALGAVATDACDAVRDLAIPHAGSSCARHVTVSVGVVAAVPVPGLRASSLVAAADAALYAAKRQGRDRWTRGDAILSGAAPARIRPGGDTLAPEPQAHGDELVLIERLTELLRRSLAWLRFPADLETDFQEQHADDRRRVRTRVVVAGLSMVVFYVWLSAPVLGDVAAPLLQRTTLLCIPALLAIGLDLRLKFGWRGREGLLTTIIGVFGLCIVWTEAAGTAPTVYAATLGLCLLPIFSSLIAAQPFRYSLVPSLLICVGVATLMAPELAERRAVWAYALCVICIATLYALVGGYLLELSNRRGYLLDRLRVAQLAVLRHNTEHLQRLATLDPLTRLPNRRHFEAELERLSAVCLATRQPLALLILDIDHFKHYNDGYGHPAGDACLQRIGAALGQWARDGGAQPVASGTVVAARLGGEEFGVLLPKTDCSAALAAAQRLRLLLRDLRIEHLHSPVGRCVTVSVGAASRVLDSAADARLLLQAADAALYRAKGLGRDQAAA